MRSMRPEQVDRRGARRRQLASGLLQGTGERRRLSEAPARRQGHPHRGADPDRRRPPAPAWCGSPRHLLVAGAAHNDLLQGQAGLVDQPYLGAGPGDLRALPLAPSSPSHRVRVTRLQYVTRETEVVVPQVLAPVEEAQLDDETPSRPPRPPRLSTRCAVASAVPAGGQHVVHDQHPLPRLDRVPVHLQGVGAVLQGVLPLDAHRRELPLLAHGHEAGPQEVRHRAGEDEPPRLDRPPRARCAASGRGRSGGRPSGGRRGRPWSGW